MQFSLTISPRSVKVDALIKSIYSDLKTGLQCLFVRRANTQNRHRNAVHDIEKEEFFDNAKYN